MDFENTSAFGLSDRQSVGLRRYFGRIYNYMAGGLAVSGISAYWATQEPLFSLFYQISNQTVSYTVLGWIAIFAPLIMIFMISSAASHMNAARAQVLFWLFSALMGISLSNIFLMYSGAAIFQAFLVTGASFLGLSLYGYTTKKSLASWGGFLVMGLIGIVVSSLVNLFVKSAALDFGLSVIAVFVFVGLTVYDTNRLKMMYDERASEEQQKSMAVNGALALYLDFINLFRLILYFLNDRR
ncbi:MAG: Bax inhibitor-1/YccA family protein [Alphaproteobacteria bacterium]